MSGSPSVKRLSVLDNLGAEITGVMLPVSLCMAITVILVKILNPEGAESSNTIVIAGIAYNEGGSTGDSSSQKFSGALLNALIFVAIITGMTLVLFVLFYYGCYKIIYAYMAFAVFDIFFIITGILLIQLLDVGNVHVDFFSFCYCLYNFSIVGCIGTLFAPIPLLLKQSYMVWVGVIVAYVFTWIPEWTSWVLLALMAVYDIIAVLVPGGPLKLLVDLAVKRQQQLPALIYEARPVNGRYQGPDHWVRRAAYEQTLDDQATARVVVANNTDNNLSDSRTPLAPPVGQSSSSPGQQQGGPTAGGGRPVGEGVEGANNAFQERSPSRVAAMHQAHGQGHSEVGAPSTQLMSAMTPRAAVHALQRLELAARTGGTSARPIAEAQEDKEGQNPGGPLAQPLVGSSTGTSVAHGSSPDSPDPVRLRETSTLEATIPIPVASHRSMASAGDVLLGAASTAVHPEPSRAAQPSGAGGDTADPAAAPAANSNRDQGHFDDFEMADGIKLGLGDFIFYAMLVGKAAMYDMMTVFASYLGIIAGLGITLICLSLFERALPALPFSIALGVAFYFLTRLVMEPFLVPMATNYIYY